MGHKYVKEDETFNTTQNGVVPKPTAQEVTDNKFLRADGTWKNPPGGGGGSGHEYSTTENVVGTWIDGKPVYEKTIYHAGGTYGSVDVPHNISNLKRVISLSTSVSDSAGASFASQYVLARISSDGVNVGISTINDSVIQYYVPSAFGNRIVDILFIIRYTKTTD